MHYYYSNANCLTENATIMKLKFVFLICFGALGFVANSFAVDLWNMGYREQVLFPNGLDEIVLHGELVMSVGPDAINAGVGEDAVYIQFNQNLGNVAISLYNESGVLIYSNVVDSGVQQSVIIPINNASSGSYSLELNNAAGYAEGFFDR